MTLEKTGKKALDGLFCFVSKLFYVICFGVVEKTSLEVFQFLFCSMEKEWKIVLDV